MPRLGGNLFTAREIPGASSQFASRAFTADTSGGGLQQILSPNPMRIYLAFADTNSSSFFVGFGGQTAPSGSFGFLAPNNGLVVWKFESAGPLMQQSFWLNDSFFAGPYYIEEVEIVPSGFANRDADRKRVGTDNSRRRKPSDRLRKLREAISAVRSAR